MSDKRRGLGRGLGALIPSSAPANASGNGAAPSRPVDLFFPEARKTPTTAASVLIEEDAAAVGAVKPAPRMLPDEKTSKQALQRRLRMLPARLNQELRPRRGALTRKLLPGKRASPVPQSSRGRCSCTNEAASTQAAVVTDDGPELVEVPGVRFAEIPVGDIHPNRKQPRSVFDEDDMAELIHSVREIGVLQPIVVRTSTEKGGEPFELVMGERRWRAVQAAGLETIPAIVRDTTDDDLLRDALLENLHRSQLNPLEEAAAYQQLLEDFGTTHEQLADRIGRSRPQVSNTLAPPQAAAAGPAQGCCECSVRWPCAGTACASRCGGDGTPGAEDRRRGNVGSRNRGGRHSVPEPGSTRQEQRPPPGCAS